jgi:hypothetical protein
MRKIGENMGGGKVDLKMEVVQVKLNTGRAFGTLKINNQYKDPELNSGLNWKMPSALKTYTNPCIEHQRCVPLQPQIQFGVTIGILGIGALKGRSVINQSQTYLSSYSI